MLEIGENCLYHVTLSRVVPTKHRCQAVGCSSQYLWSGGIGPSLPGQGGHLTWSLDSGESLPSLSTVGGNTRGLVTYRRTVPGVSSGTCRYLLTTCMCGRTTQWAHRAGLGGAGRAQRSRVCVYVCVCSYVCQIVMW